MKKILAATLCLFIVACSTLQYDKSVFFIGKFIDLDSIEATSYVREKDGHTMLNITGVSPKNQVFYYKVEWYDEYGMPIKSIMSTWNSKSVAQDIPFDITAVSPNKRAVRYKVYITRNIGNGKLL